MSQEKKTGTVSPVVSDEAIWDALLAWLAVLGIAPPQLPHPQATDHCVSLCKLFSQFAPDHLSFSQYSVPQIVPGTNAIRQRRYIARSLARSLTDWFQLGRPSNSFPPQESTATGNTRPPVDLTSDVSEALLRFSEETEYGDLEGNFGIVRLGEVVLCAALHSEKKDVYIEKISTLHTAHQVALAASVRRTSTKLYTSDASDFVNISNGKLLTNGTGNFPVHSQPNLQEEKSIALPGISLATYNALVTERDTLRMDLDKSEAIKGFYARDVHALRNSIDEAEDRIIDLSAMLVQKETTVKTKADALISVKEALEDVRVSDEELNALRDKAGIADKLQENLEQVSSRLAEAVGMKWKNQDLQRQLDGYQESNSRNIKHSEFLEAQLRNSLKRIRAIASISGRMSTVLDEKESQISTMKGEIERLKGDLNIVNNRLASMMMQGNSSASTHDFSSSPSLFSIEENSDSSGGSFMRTSNAKDHQHAHEPNHDSECAISIDSFCRALPFDEEIVCNRIYQEVGRRLSWEEIFECIQLSTDECRKTVKLNGRKSIRYITGMQNLLARAKDNGDSAASSGMHSSSRPTNSKQSHTEVDSPTDSKFIVSIEYEEEELLSTSSQSLNISAPRTELGAQSSEFADNSSLSVFHDANGTPASSDGTHTPDSSTGTFENSAKDSMMSAAVVYDSSPLSRMGAEYFGAPRNEETISLLIGSDSQESEAKTDGYNTPRTALSQSSSPGSYIVTKRSGVGRSTEARELMKQVRCELQSLQEAMNAMREERMSSASVGAIFREVTNVREELFSAHSLAAVKEAQNCELRQDLNTLMKEYDCMKKENKMAEERESAITEEKERLAMVLQDSLSCKEDELRDAREEIVRLKKSERALEDLKCSSKEKLEAVQAMSKARDLEIVHLSNKTKDSEEMAARLRAAVRKSDSLQKQIDLEQELYIANLEIEARRERQLAEEAREEARRVADRNASVTTDLQATVAAASMVWSRDAGKERECRKRARASDFWRKLLCRDKKSSHGAV